MKNKIIVIVSVLVLAAFEFIAALIHFEAWQERTMWFISAILTAATNFFLWVLFTTLLKRLIARLFGFDRDERHDIMWINIKAQALLAAAMFLAWEMMSLMCVFYPDLDGDNVLRLIPGLILPVVLSYNYEYRAYRRQFDTISTSKIDRFMLTAIAISLILSLLIDR